MGTTNYIFDVDNTLTPPTEKIMPELSYQLDRLFDVKDKKVYFVSGSDLRAIESQLGPRHYHRAANVFGCSGNQPRDGSVTIFIPPKKLSDFLMKELANCPFEYRTSRFIEYRIGSVNFAPVGRDADKAVREKFEKWDNTTLYRKSLRKKLKDKFPELTIDIGGQISLDIYPKGHGKEQILDLLPMKQNDTIVFFGDRMQKGGNDYRLAKLITNHNLGTAIEVKNWVDTYSILRSFGNE
jgi:phosphomannomutase